MAFKSIANILQYGQTGIVVVGEVALLENGTMLKGALWLGGGGRGDLAWEWWTVGEGGLVEVCGRGAGGEVRLEMVWG